MGTAAPSRPMCPLKAHINIQTSLEKLTVNTGNFRQLINTYVALICPHTTSHISHAALQIQHQDDLKKRINKRTDAWQNGCFRKMYDHLVHTIPNPKMDFHAKTFLQIILAAKWLVWHSSTSPQTAATTFAFSSVCFFLNASNLPGVLYSYLTCCNLSLVL